MRLCILSGLLVYVHFILPCSAIPGTKEYPKISGRASEFVPSSSMRPWNGGMGREPSCEELRAMWRFSKRQSRASEITNEISTYRDPFAYNVWEPHARSRSVGGGVLKGGGGRGSGRHIYGRVVHAAPRSRQRDNPPERIKTYDEVARHMVTYPDGQQVVIPRRKVTAFRFSGGHAPVEPIPVITPQAGSFQRLKEILREERARELQEQRLAEEAAARAAALDVYSPQRLPPQEDPIRYGRRSMQEKRDDSEAPSETGPFSEFLPPSVEDEFLPLSAFAG
ncbi:uncharacterized protein [Anabrus simplex]|uniref:uncharacterized protein n=1 Tax=Anabrus simplex TaxID=316456 RepID=UPI0035A2965D